MEVVRLKLSPDAVTPPAQRWDETTDEVQISPDGGTTWYPDPTLDPRSSSVYRQPERGGTDPKCDAAADMVATLTALIDTTIAGIGIVQTANAILGVITVFTPGIGWMIKLILAIVEALLAIGTTVIDAAFTQAVYDDLLCIFYQNIDGNGQMSDAQLADMYDDVAATQSATVQAVFGHFSSLIGAVGWSNAGATGSTTGNCVLCACDDPCLEYDFEISNGDFVNVAQTIQGNNFPAVSTYDTYGGSFPQGWEVQTQSGQNYLSIRGYCACAITNRLVCTGYRTPGGSATIWVDLVDDTTGELIASATTSQIGNGSWSFTIPYAQSADIGRTNVRIKVGVSGTSGFGIVLTSLQLAHT